MLKHIPSFVVTTATKTYCAFSSFLIVYGTFYCLKKVFDFLLPTPWTVNATRGESRNRCSCFQCFDIFHGGKIRPITLEFSIIPLNMKFLRLSKNITSAGQFDVQPTENKNKSTRTVPNTHTKWISAVYIPTSKISEQFVHMLVYEPLICCTPLHGYLQA